MKEDPTSAPKILIPDDEPEIRALLLRSLENTSSSCTISSSAYQALDLVLNERYSLVMSDVCMPGMSGIELLRGIKSHDPDVAAIMITGLVDVTTAVDALKLGACDYITKPFDLVAVRNAVNKALERRRLMLESRCYQQELERLVDVLCPT